MPELSPLKADRVPPPQGQHSPRRTLFAVLGDSSALLTVLFLANWILASKDPGWLSLNPSPWLLLPAFLGARYGLGSGVIGSIAAGIGIAALQFLAPEGVGGLLGLVGEHPYFFLSLLAGGAIASLGQALAVGPARKVERERDLLAEEAHILQSDLALHRENEIVLQESLLLHGAEASSLTEEMHRLFCTDNDAWLPGFLTSLQRSAGVIQAAIYLPQQHRWVRSALVGNPAELPETLDGNTDPVLVEAVRRGVTVSCRSVWSADEEAGERSAWIAAIPWGTAPGAPVSAVLALRRMEFDHIHWDQLARIEAAFTWVMTHAEIAARRAQPAGSTLERPDNLLDILEPREFVHRIRLALDAARELGLPSRLVTFRPQEGCTEETWLALREALRSTLRPVDSLGLLVGETTSALRLGLLLPAASDEGAKKRLEFFFSRFPQLRPLVADSILPISDPALLAGILATV
ncbi:MAG: hypothetical protein WBE58_16025 [Verrucomicrobiales bacterium]